MSIGYRLKQHVSIFHLIDHLWDINGYIFHCIPNHKDEARIAIPKLIPLFKHRFGTEVENCFTPQAVERMNEVRHDVKMGDLQMATLQKLAKGT